MPRLSKLDRMSEIQAVIEDVDLTDAQSRLEEFAQAAQVAVEAMENVVQSAQTAAEAHEEREWESRNDALSEIPDQLEVFAEAIEELENLDADFVATLRVTLAQARKAAGEASDHADHLIEV